MSDAIIPAGEDGARSPTLRLATRGPLFDSRTALLDRLELAFPTKQFARVWLPAKPSKDTWKRQQAKLPMVGLCWLGFTPAETSGRVLHGEAEWLVYLGCQNQRPEALLTGDKHGLGALGLASLASALLHGWTVRDLGYWTVKAVDNAALQDFGEEDVAIVALQVSCALSLVDRDAADALPEFLRVGAQWDLPPIGGETVDNVRVT